MFRRLLKKIKMYPLTAHMIRAIGRFNERKGTHFSAAITYYSFLSLIPLLMISFAAAGFFLASNPDILAGLINKIVSSISDPAIVETLKRIVDAAIRQRTTVGITGLLLALYSGLSWMGSLREAVCVMSRDVWLHKSAEGSIITNYLRDCIALIGLVITLILSVSLSSFIGTVQNRLLSSFPLDHIAWIQNYAVLLTAVCISVAANFMMFLWIFWVLPRKRAPLVYLLRGSLLAAIGFEMLKVATSYVLPALAKSPSGAMFGSTMGLLVCFNLFARLTLFCAAWIATSKPGSPLKKG